MSGYLVHANDGDPDVRIEIRESTDPDAVPPTEAFRLAKIMAGWEEQVKDFWWVVRSSGLGRRPPMNEEYLRG